uniref:Family with sequence similarity 234 member A n=1 Tax=Malurus cyaneus samueli TaxID=2593467 RepID=A0A8C5U0P0_9PASS
VMDNKDSEAEIHPLKTEEVKVQENHEHCVERRIIKSSGLSRLSRWRTAAFFISLFLCLIIVFAFSFIIPCPERPPGLCSLAVAYQFLAIEDVNEDKVQDVVFAFKASNGSSRLPSPCAFIAAVSGTNGSALWESPTGEDVQWLQCGIQQLGTAEAPGCLVVGKPLSLTAIDLRTGEVVWRQSRDFGANYTALTPLSVIPDVDNDRVQDLIIFITKGDQVCHPEALITPVAEPQGLSGMLFISTFKTIHGLKSLIISLSFFSFGDFRYLVKVPVQSRDNVLVLHSEMATLINTKDLRALWTLNVSRVMVVESGSGTVQWDLKLNSGSGNLGPATLSTADHRSAFLIWGDYQEPGNETVSGAAEGCSSPAFGPELSGVTPSHSVAVPISVPLTLQPLVRHACYVLLRGPQPGEAPGPVSLMKRKLKEDVSESKVIWLSPMAGDNEQHIRDRLHRMRFHSRA